MKKFPLDKSVTWKQASKLHEQINPFSYSCPTRRVRYYITVEWEALYHKIPFVILSRKAILSVNITTNSPFQHFIVLP